MMKFLFKATDAQGKTVKFDIREPAGRNASANAWARAELICKAKGWTNLR